MRWSDDSTGAASHFACAYRVASPGATREPIESSWGHVLVFGTVPSANTLIRWVDEKRLRPHSAGSTLPHLWPTGSSRGGPHRLRPGTSPHALRIPPRGGHPALRVSERRLQVPLGCIRLSPSCPFRVLHTFLSPASEELPPLSDTAPLIRAPEGLQPS